MCIKDRKDFEPQEKIPKIGYKVLLELREGKLISPVFADYDGTGYSRTEWNDDLFPHGFCFYFRKKDAEAFRKNMERESGEGMKALTVKVTIDNAMYKGVNCYGNLPEVPCFVARQFKFVVSKQSGESGTGVGDGSDPKNCPSLPIGRQQPTPKT
jgi:hypothetical protein